jgi:hypothetical protein
MHFYIKKQIVIVSYYSFEQAWYFLMESPRLRT